MMVLEHGGHLSLLLILNGITLGMVNSLFVQKIESTLTSIQLRTMEFCFQSLDHRGSALIDGVTLVGCHLHFYSKRCRMMDVEIIDDFLDQRYIDFIDSGLTLVQNGSIDLIYLHIIY